MRALGIDIGTTTLKGAVLDVGAGRLGELYQLPFPPHCAPQVPGRHAVSMDALLEAVDCLLARLLRDAPEAAHLFLCGQMHGIAVLDPSGTKALTPFVTWKDRRTLEPHPNGQGSFLEFYEALLTPEERAALGNEYRPGLGALTLACLQAEQSLPDGSIPATVCDAILAVWTGRAPVLDPSFAASLGAYDLRTHTWSAEVLAKWALDRFRWPEVSTGRGAVYEITRNGHSLTVYPALGDHQAALLGTGLGENELSINVSTGSQIAALTSQFAPGAYQTRPFLNGLYLNTFTHLPAGRMLDLLLDLLTEISGGQERVEDPWATIHRAVERVPETSLRIDLAFSRCLTGSEGRMDGLTEETLRVGHLFRAAFAHMADNYASHATRLDATEPWDVVALSGGLARRAPALRAEIERAFQRPLRVSAESEETLSGLLKWGAQCLS